MSDEGLLNPRKVRAEQIVQVTFDDGSWVEARRCDIASMLFEGVVPTPLMQAAEKFIQNRELKPTERLEDLSDEDRPAMLETLRHHAVAVVIRPTIVMMDDGDPDHLPVEILTVPQLLAIWNQTAVVPKVGAAEAATFRWPQRPTPQSLLRHGQDIRSAAEPVAPPDIERRGA